MKNYVEKKFHVRKEICEKKRFSVCHKILSKSFSQHFSSLFLSAFPWETKNLLLIVQRGVRWLLFLHLVSNTFSDRLEIWRNPLFHPRWPQLGDGKQSEAPTSDRPHWEQPLELFLSSSKMFNTHLPWINYLIRLGCSTGRQMSVKRNIKVLLAAWSFPYQSFLCKTLKKRDAYESNSFIQVSSFLLTRVSWVISSGKCCGSFTSSSSFYAPRV